MTKENPGKAANRKRRRFLRTIGTLGIAGIAGCQPAGAVDTELSTDEETKIPTEESPGTVTQTSTETAINVAEDFSPADLSDLVGWYDAMDLNRSPDESVAEWADSSDTNNGARQREAEFQPTYLEDGFAGGTPTVQFDGERDYLWAPEGNDMLDELDRGTVVYVIEPDNVADINHLWLASVDPIGSGWLTGSGHHTFFVIIDGKAQFAVGDFGANEVPVTGGVVQTTPNVLIAHWNPNELSVRVGGQHVASDTYESSGDPRDMTLIGGTPDGNRMFDGGISEMLFYDRELSDDELRTLETHLIDKWLPIVIQGVTWDEGPVTITGELIRLGNADSVDVNVEFQKSSDTEWTTFFSQTFTEPSTFSADFSEVIPQTLYQFRARMTSDDLGTIASPVQTFQTTILTLSDPSEVTGTSATLRGELLRMGQADAVDVYFEYRERPQSDWTATDERQTLEEPGEYSIEIPVKERRIYDYRAVANAHEFETVTTESDTFVTSNPDSEQAASIPQSISAHDMSDGFADPAPWLGDETPIIPITEPSRTQLERALHVDYERLVVFETSGTIDLDGEVGVTDDKLYLAGQTAPSPGITLIRGKFTINADDCVLQHVRVRPGDADQDTGWAPDAISLSDGTANNVIDHCTGTWGVDENFGIGYSTTDTTISNCLIAEPLNDATHPKGEHGYNALIGNHAKTVACMGNVFAYATDRNPRLKEGTETVVANNLVHRYADGMWADPDTEHSIVGNVFQWPVSEQANVFGDGSVYPEDNALDWDADVPMIGEGITRLDSRPLWPDELDRIATDRVQRHNLTNAGARPADRTEHDERVVENVRTAGGSVIDSQEDVGGYPDLPENSHSLDVPRSGTQEWLHRWTRRVEARVAKQQPSTTAASVGERITFEVEDTSGPNRWIDSLGWSFGNSETASGWWTDHRYDSPGTYIVSLTATDNAGNSTIHEVAITVDDLAEPIARAEPSTTAASVGERITFEVEDTSGSDRWIDSLEWSFGDGTTAEGWWTEHHYEETGEYTVSLTATDNTGHATTHEVTITVT